MAYLGPERAIRQILRDDADVLALVAERIRPQKAAAADRAAGAYIVYNDVSSTSFEHFEGASGMAQALMQIDGFSRDDCPAAATSTASSSMAVAAANR